MTIDATELADVSTIATDAFSSWAGSHPQMSANANKDARVSEVFIMVSMGSGQAVGDQH